MKKLPDIEILNDFLTYDQNTGLLYWKHRKNKSKKWNDRYAGKEAFTAKHVAGYRHGSVNSIHCLAHRVIYKMVYNEEPPEVDHIDGNRANNKIDNLRASNKSKNQMNAKKRKNCASKYKGVQFYKARKNYMVKCNRKFIGYFENEYDAALAYNFMALKEFGEHAKFNIGD